MSISHDALRQLHEEYIFKLNAAVESQRTPLIAELAAAYPDDAQQLIAAGWRRS
jgi:hypothetical protein